MIRFVLTTVTHVCALKFVREIYLNSNRFIHIVTLLAVIA